MKQFFSILALALFIQGLQAQPISGLQQEVSETAMLQKASELIDRAAHPFTAKDINGQTVSYNELHERPVVLLFFSVESEKTVEFIVGASFLHDAFKDFGVKVYGLCLDDSEAKTKAFFKAHSASFPVVANQYKLAVESYQVQEFGLPAAMIVAPSGLVTQIWSGGRLYQRNEDGEISAFVPTNASSGPMMLYQSMKEAIKRML